MVREAPGAPDRPVTDLSAQQRGRCRSRRPRASTRKTACSGGMNRRRLDAECIRDTILSASGQLRHDMGGPGFPGGPGRRLRLHGPPDAAERLRPGLPQRPAGAVRGVRLRRPEHGRRSAQREHGRAPGTLPDEPPVRARPGPDGPRAGSWPAPITTIRRARREPIGGRSGAPPTPAERALAVRFVAGAVRRAFGRGVGHGVPGPMLVGRFPLRELTGPPRFEPRSPRPCPDRSRDATS